MQTQMQIFEHDEFGKLEVLMIDGKPYFPATECATILGYSRPHNAIERHCRYSLKRGVPHPQSPDKQIEVNFIPEGDLYRLIVRSKLQAAERFEKWTFDEVLPSIRKFGGYVTDNALDQLIENPEAAMKFFTTLKAERTKKDKLESYIEEIEPKARYYDIVMQCPGLIPVTIIAKDFGYGAAAFNQLLHAFRVQFKRQETLVLYQPYADKGYTVSKTYRINEKRSVIHTYFTQKGRCFIYELLKSHGILPLAERTTENHE